MGTDSLAEAGCVSCPHRNALPPLERWHSGDGSLCPLCPPPHSHWPACMGGGGAGSEQKLQPEEFLPAPAFLVENPRIRSLIFRVPLLGPSPALTSSRPPAQLILCAWREPVGLAAVCPGWPGTCHVGPGEGSCERSHRNKAVDVPNQKQNDISILPKGASTRW